MDTKGRVGGAPAGTAPGPCSSQEQQRERKPTGHKVASHTVACRPKGPHARAEGRKESRTAPGKALSVRRPAHTCPVRTLSAPRDTLEQPSHSSGAQTPPACQSPQRQGGRAAGYGPFPALSSLGPACLSPHGACGDTHAPSSLFANNGPHFENKLFLRQHLPEAQPAPQEDLSQSQGCSRDSNSRGKRWGSLPHQRLPRWPFPDPPRQRKAGRRSSPGAPAPTLGPATHCPRRPSGNRSD